MLDLDVPSIEVYNNKTSEFDSYGGYHLRLEHSLISISKWEAKYHRPFLGKAGKTTDETLGYVQCMCTQYVPTIDQIRAIPPELFKQITEYIHDPMTATWFTEDKRTGKTKQEVITSEVIYYQMVTLQIPFECQRWHLNRLMTLIQVIGVKNQPKKKRSRRDILSEQQMLNQQRRQMLQTKG